jgi:cob(I)alamin adenosyltransferase
MKGYIQIYTENGKGKITASIGLTLRALSAGNKVFFAQFAKRKIYSEIKVLDLFDTFVTVK